MISVILPTIRPQNVEKCLANLSEASKFVLTEVVVVADFEPSNGHSPWIVRERNGVVDAINAGYRAAKGDYIYLTNDETLTDSLALFELWQAAVLQPGRLLTPKHLPEFNFAYYGKPFAAFPFAHRDVYEKLGGFFDPAFKAFYADPDLSMRAHAAGVPVECVESAVILHHNGGDKSQSWEKWFASDQATFRAKWDHLGVFRDP